MHDSPITLLAGADFYSLLGNGESGTSGWRAVVATRRRQLEQRLEEEMRDYTLWRITNRRGSAKHPQSDVTRQLWLASRSAAIGTREVGGERARALLDALALPQPQDGCGPEDDLLVEVCLEVAITILLLTRVWSHSLWTKGGAIWSPLAHSVIIDSVALNEMPDLEAFGWLITDNRQRKVLNGWLGYQAALVMEGLELLENPQNGSRPILSSEEGRGLRMRFAKLCCEAVSSSATDTMSGPIEVPQREPEKEKRSLVLGGIDGKITPMGPRDLLAEAAGAASTNGRTLSTGLTAAHIEWLTSVLRYLLLKESGAPRTRSDLASAIAFLPPMRGTSALVSPRRLHAATTLSGVSEPGWSRGGVASGGDAVVNELRAILGERCVTGSGASGCECHAACGPADDRRGDLAWALIGEMAEGSSPSASPNCLITTTYDRVVMCALDDVGLPYRVIVPADSEFSNGSEKEWLIGQFSRGIAQKWWCIEGVGEVNAESGEHDLGAPWADRSELGNDGSFVQRLPLLPGEGPVVIALMGSPMLELPNHWEHRLALGEMSLHRQFLLMGDVMRGLLKEALGETTAGERRTSRLLGLDGWSHTDRHSLIWLYTHVARDVIAESPQVWSSAHSSEPAMLYWELLESEPSSSGEFTQIMSRADRARRSRQMTAGQAR